VYGSIAKGEENQRSDVDLLVVGDVTFTEAVKALSSAQEALGREINPTVYPLTNSAPDLLKTITSYGIFWMARRYS
jgi:predicted nucleotidyltransferase